jgi:hypothetical protein
LDWYGRVLFGQRRWSRRSVHVHPKTVNAIQGLQNPTATQNAESDE